jgi:hypothetical protein
MGPISTGPIPPAPSHGGHHQPAPVNHTKLTGEDEQICASRRVDFGAVSGPGAGSEWNGPVYWGFDPILLVLGLDCLPTAVVI